MTDFNFTFPVLDRYHTQFINNILQEEYHQNLSIHNLSNYLNLAYSTKQLYFKVCCEDYFSSPELFIRGNSNGKVSYSLRLPYSLAVLVAYHLEEQYFTFQDLVDYFSSLIEDIIIPGALKLGGRPLDICCLGTPEVTLGWGEGSVASFFGYTCFHYYPTNKKHKNISDYLWVKYLCQKLTFFPNESVIKIKDSILRIQRRNIASFYDIYLDEEKISCLDHPLLRQALEKYDMIV